MCPVKGLSFIFFLVSPVCFVFASDVFTCHMGNQTDWKQQPVLVPVRSSVSGRDGECISVHVWMTAEDFQNESMLEIQSSQSYRKFTIKSRRKNKKFIRFADRGKVRCQEPGGNNLTVWKLVYNCVYMHFGESIKVFLTTGTGRKEQGSYKVSGTTNHNIRKRKASYMTTQWVSDPVPEFHLSVDRRSRSVNVTILPGDRVTTRLCYKGLDACDSVSSSSDITIDPLKSLSAIFNFTYLLPCVCVEVYYTHNDAKRRHRCPFENDTLFDVRDVWNSGKVKPYESMVTWISMCTSNNLKPSAALCWKHYETHLCTPILNSTLDVIQEDQKVTWTKKYNISAVDKHPQMCVQFSFQGSYDTRCLFQNDTPKWDSHIGAVRQRVLVYLTSSQTANYSAQLCVLSEMGCHPRGRVYSVKMEGGAAETQMNVPSEGLPLEKTCVQVWRSDPAMHGRRILCLDTTHRRYGLFGVAALVFAVTLALLGIIVRHVTRKGVAGWLSAHRPVLLVSSSDQTSHVSAVGVLASILQGEVCTTVRLAQWAHCSDRGARSAAGAAAVADLGPLPWLYGQWEAVRRSEGKVLIVWSPEANKYYERWRGESGKVDRNERRKQKACEGEKMNEELEEDWKLKEKRLGKGRKQKGNGQQGSGKLTDVDGMEVPQSEPSSVTEPVFIAAMASLQAALQEQGKDHGVAFVYFEGHGHSRDIPKDLRNVPRYCLPQDFRGLIQELGGTVREPQSGKSGWYCWPQLLSKTLSLWLAQRLAHRLRNLLRQTQAHRTKVRRQRLESPVLTPEAEQEQEPLHVSPC